MPALKRRARSRSCLARRQAVTLADRNLIIMCGPHAHQPTAHVGGHVDLHGTCRAAQCRNYQLDLYTDRVIGTGLVGVGVVPEQVEEHV